MEQAYHTSQPSTQAFSPSIYRAPLVRTSRKRRCPECDKYGFCEIAFDGSRAHCMNNPSPHPCRTRLGGWWHYYRDEGTPSATKALLPRVAAPTQRPERAPVERLHGVYATMLRDHLVLSEPHRSALRQRGLSDVAIEAHGYRSAPTSRYGANVARALAREHDLRGVPGFFKQGNEWRIVALGIGFYVPVRDACELISGMQIRRDEGTKYLWLSSTGSAGGASSGAPIHYAKAHLLAETDEVTITEGALKSEVAAYLLNAPVIGVAGVSSFGADFASGLKQRFPQLRCVAIAFDMDVWQKPQVAAALDKLITQLECARFCVRVRTWPENFKGIDDYLVAQAQLGQEVAK